MNYSVFLFGSQVVITSNGETVKVIEVNPNTAVEKFVEISNKIKNLYK